MTDSASNHQGRALVTSALAFGLALTIGCGTSGLQNPLTKTAIAARAQAVFGDAADADVVVSFRDRQQLQGMVNAGIDAEGMDMAGKRFRTVLDLAQFEAASRLGAKITRDTRRARGYDAAYRTYSQLGGDLRALVAKQPELAEVVDVGDGWEKTQKTADRDILALHIGKKNAGKPVVLYAGCHHARELVTPEMVLKMAQLLINGYGTDPEITGLVDTRDIWLVPMVNPDGHAKAEKGKDQRKNTNIITGGKNRIGVDLNRNYGAPEWGNVGTSHSPESDTFCGASAFSEPETAAMRDLMKKIKPIYLLTFHSYSNVVLWPWGYTEAPPPDKRLELVGKKLGELSGYEAGQSSTQLYATAGDDTDWAFKELGTLAYTVEIGGWGDGFDPPYSSVAKFWDENRPMMLYALRTADNPAAAAGPELNGPRNRVAAAEYFVGGPGRTGAGRATPPIGGARQLVWGHGKDAKGNWGPWSITWSK